MRLRMVSEFARKTSTVLAVAGAALVPLTLCGREARTGGAGLHRQKRQVRVAHVEAQHEGFLFGGLSHR